MAEVEVGPCSPPLPLHLLRVQVSPGVWRRPSSDMPRRSQRVSLACNAPVHPLCESRLARGLLCGVQHLFTKSEWQVPKALSKSPRLGEALSWLHQLPALPWEAPVKGSVLAAQ